MADISSSAPQDILPDVSTSEVRATFIACEGSRVNGNAIPEEELIEGERIPIERSEQEYFERNTRLGCILFVGNLPFQTPWQHVKDRFQEAGKVRYTDLIADAEGRPKGSALVTMESSDGAQRAIELFNEQLFDGRRLIVRLLEAGRRPPLVQRERMPVYGRGRGAQAGPVVDGPRNTSHVAPQQFVASGMGQCIGARPSRGGMQGYGRGVRTNYDAHHQQNVLGVTPSCGSEDLLPKPRSRQLLEASEEAGRRLFVGNLPYDCNSAALHDTFQQVGTVVRAEVRLGRNARPTGIGVVVMGTPDEARIAINEFDGIEMAGRAMRVSLDNSAPAI